jgi:ligand-binding SRPBCC domain-containing protein
VAVITLVIEIKAPIERVFDLFRSIDLHTASVSHTGERAVGGVTSGLISLGEEVTWRARHFGIWQNLTARITAFDRPIHFHDTLVRGAFRRFDHDHFFSQRNGVTLMRDVMDFESPFGIFGRMADRLLLSAYMRQLLATRNSFIKVAAETDQWERYVHQM